MTYLGKILVIVNLVFSLVTGALLIVVFATRTNWKVENDKLQTAIKAYHQDAAAAIAEREAERKASEDKRKTLLVNVAAELKVPVNQERTLDEISADLTTGIKKLQKDQADAVAAEKAKTDQAELRARAADTNFQTVRIENKRLQDEIVGLQNDVAERNKRINVLADESKNWHDRFVDADIRAKSALDRNRNLMDQLELVSKENERLKIAGATGGGRTEITSNPPPEDVHGRVKATDAQSGYVTIDVGSDAGINKDNTLEVYRLKPEPKYLGTIRIVAVNPHEAVGRPVTAQRKGLIQVGDEVAANIMGKR